MSRILIQANEVTAAQRRVYFHLVGTDGITPANAEADGQPQVSYDGKTAIGGPTDGWTNTGIGTLVLIGNGRYYALLTQAAVATPGTIIESRYKSATTAECPGDGVQVVGFDPASLVPESPVITPPVDPTQSTGVLVTYDGQGARQGVVPIVFRITDTSSAGAKSFPQQSFTLTSDADGDLQEEFARGFSYEGRRGKGAWVAFTVPDAGSFNLPEILGHATE